MVAELTVCPRRGDRRLRDWAPPIPGRVAQQERDRTGRLARFSLPNRRLDLVWKATKCSRLIHDRKHLYFDELLGLS